MASKVRSLAVKGTIAAVIAVMVASLTPATAQASVWYYGYADCSSTTYPSTGTVGPGYVKHEIQATGGYRFMEWQNGSTPYWRRFQNDWAHYSSWATLITDDDSNTRSWGCRALY